MNDETKIIEIDEENATEEMGELKEDEINA